MKINIEKYRGYEIHTKDDKSSHSSLIYKDGVFISAVSGDTIINGIKSTEKSKIKIDNILK